MATSTTSTPHDAVFKQFLCHPDTARDFLEIHLPTTLRQICNLNTLRLESGSFIEEDLRPIIPIFFGRWKQVKVKVTFTWLLNIRVRRTRIWHFG
ncbi:Uncharacterized protein YfaD [Salmonella enterica subsp. enterica]|nr:Uncharacterized protein YfaD [Salmonella enterica subsp. enterica]